MSGLSRRDVLGIGAGALAAGATGFETLAQPAQPAGDAERHGMSSFGELKYPEGFPHFDFVNPNAPKGGLVRLGALGTFDSFNIVVAGVKGSPEQGLGLIYETLTTSALDEPSAAYGLLAESFSFPEDYSSVSFRLRPEARWHDGKPVTVDDVIDALISELSEDVQKFGGMAAVDEPYLQIGLGQMVRKRAGWLSALFLGEIVAIAGLIGLTFWLQSRKTDFI